MTIKTRFAPSPTGYLHIGSVRTALFAWLFAKKQNGQFILRIDDTDIERSTQQDINAIIDGMNWLNLDWDEGPYFQSKRFERYNAIINEMLTQGTAYKCYCSKERIETLRKIQIANGKKPIYDGHCRNIHKYTPSKNTPYVVRFRNPQEGSVIFNDHVRGLIKFSNQELDDLVIRRTNGTPTYNFCVVIDDADMKITHVIRGEDHINNTPRQINIFKALGVSIPEYAHVSIIVDKYGKKLSKRHGAVGVMQYRDNGFIPEALLNYLVRLGWSHGDQEIFSIKQMKQLFNLNTISKSASIFNTKKLLWINQYYINHLPVDYVATHLAWHIKQLGINISTGPQLTELVQLLGKRCKTLKEIAASCNYFYQDFSEFDINAAKNNLSPEAERPLRIVYEKLATLTIWSPKTVHKAIVETSEELNLEISKVCMPLRVAVTGNIQSPALDVTVHTIGKLRSLSRINKALAYIAKLM